MPFEISEEEIKKTEDELGARLPHDYREAMKVENGGEGVTKEDDWEFYPIRDTSNKKKISRTCYHIINETESCHGFGYFPEHAIAIANNGFGDQMIFLKEGNTYADTVYLWLHESGEIEKLADNFSQIEKF